jgi:hypothetical protein
MEVFAMARGSKGGVATLRRSPEYLSVMLYDFDARSYQLKPVHKSWLEQHVIYAELGSVGRVVLTGYAQRREFKEWDYADPDTAAEYDDATATARAYSVWGYLNARYVQEIEVEDEEVIALAEEDEQLGHGRSVKVEVLYHGVVTWEAPWARG